jgi:EAL and modified HD-GYP domain-containing signal transduction protein
VLLGSERIRAWATVMVLSKLVDKPHELMRIALARAKMCERLAFSTGLSQRAESLFMVGLFSVLDAIMDMPMSFVVERLPLVADVALALTSHGSQLGPVLECVLAYERGEFDKVDKMPLRAAAVRTAYLEAVAWADGACRQFLQDGKAATAAAAAR